MATWGDYLSLTLTISLVAALIYGFLYLNAQFRKAVHSTKEQLSSHGIEISKTGASVKTSTKLANREEYFDATQRGIVKALSTASVGHNGTGPRAEGSSTAASRSSPKLAPGKLSRHASSTTSSRRS